MKKFLGIFLVLAMLGFSNAAFAEEEQEEVEQKPVEQKVEKVKTGIVASTETTGKPSAINVETSGSSPGDEVSAVSGSISRGKKNECIARILNNGTKTYSVTFSVEGVNKRGLKTLSRNFSASVAPKGVVEKKFGGCNEDLSLYVNLKSAKPSGK